MGIALAAVCGLGMFILWIYGMVWVYNDSKARGDSPALWTILTFFFSSLALIIYGAIKGARTGIIVGVVMIALGILYSVGTISFAKDQIANGNLKVTTSGTTSGGSTTP